MGNGLSSLQTHPLQISKRHGLLDTNLGQGLRRDLNVISGSKQRKYTAERRSRPARSRYNPSGLRIASSRLTILCLYSDQKNHRKPTSTVLLRSTASELLMPQPGLMYAILPGAIILPNSTPIQLDKSSVSKS